MTYVIPCKKCGENFKKFSSISSETECFGCRDGRTRRNKYAQREKLIGNNKDKVMERIEKLEDEVVMLKVSLETEENEINQVVKDIEYRASEVLKVAVEKEVKRLLNEEFSLAKKLKKEFTTSLVTVRNQTALDTRRLSERLTFMEKKSGIWMKEHDKVSSKHTVIKEIGIRLDELDEEE